MSSGMAEPVHGTEPELNLRPATMDDAPTVFGWRNDRSIIRLGTQDRAVGWDEHQAWFRETIAEVHRRMFIITLDGAPVGQVRFDKGGFEGCRVSIYLINGYTGRGLGVAALRRGCRKILSAWDVPWVIAQVMNGNDASLSAFTKAGFEPWDEPVAQTPEGHTTFRYVRHVIPHNRVSAGAGDAECVADVVRSGQWAAGPRVAALESALADQFQTAHAVAVGSGLAALRLTLKGLGVEPGERVLLPAYSCVALANAVLSLGAVPLAADVDGVNWNLDLEAAERAAGDGVQVAIAVNTFGAPAPVGALKDLGFRVIEDCSHGFALSGNGQPDRLRGDAAVFSFYATKLIGGGEGGAVLTNSDAVSAAVRDWRDYTDKAPNGDRLNDKMTDMEAALVHRRLERLATTLEARRELAAWYADRLARLAEQTGAFRLPESVEPRVWYRYAVELLGPGVDEVVSRMSEHRVAAARPVEQWNADDGKICETAERAFSGLVSLPFYPDLTPSEFEKVCDVFGQAIGQVIGEGG